MDNRTNKPMLSSAELIQKMRDEKGITFKYISESKAEAYLTDTNNYLRTAAYRKNYQKYTLGANTGKYINLDFAYLQDLSTIDMHLRFMIMKMCSDIEHALKVQLINYITQDNSSNGYDVVKDYFAHNPGSVNKLDLLINSPFTGDLINKYFTLQPTFDQSSGRSLNHIVAYDDCPIWVLCELISFGEFVKLYTQYYNSNSIPAIRREILHLVKSLRNASAHNNCIISSLSHKTSSPPREIKEAIMHFPNVTKSQRQKKLSNRPMLEFVSLLYVYDKVIFGKVRYHRINELKELFFERMVQKKGFYKDNELIRSHYAFATAIINGFFPHQSL